MEIFEAVKDGVVVFVGTSDEFCNHVRKMCVHVREGGDCMQVGRGTYLLCVGGCVLVTYHCHLRYQRGLLCLVWKWLAGSLLCHNRLPS